MAHDVFISYPAEDKATADAVTATLEKNGIRCWIAPRDILGGQDWAEAIVDAIAASRVMVVILSSHSNNSPHIKREVQHAISKGVTVVPLRIEDVPLSKALDFFVGNQHWLDAITPPMQKHLDQLAANVSALLARPGDGPTAMVRCPRCGKENLKDVRYCGACGEPLHGARGPGPKPPPGPRTDQAKNANRAFWLGIASLAAWFIPIIGLPVSIVGLVLGYKGLQAANNNRAVWGMVLSCIGLALSITNAILGVALLG